eukprot:TRINITY_DN25129_c0_g1_i2.p2 TRINITY_DN25129_c0_g1~~TRINITY_DN25129_c0_g1_i2.p2  ORF type:complete len:124 (+),score=11.33 TRINITY_DN25129_c0_g1_i2:110-481(+)
MRFQAAGQDKVSEENLRIQVHAKYPVLLLRATAAALCILQYEQVNTAPGCVPAGTVTCTCWPHGEATCTSCPGHTPCGQVTCIVLAVAGISTAAVSGWAAGCLCVFCQYGFDGPLCAGCRGAS